MGQLAPDTGFVLRCNLDGAILCVEHDNVGLDPMLTVGRPLLSLASPAGVGKLLDFLLTVKQETAAFDWELNVQLNGAIETLHFAGVLLGQEMLVIGAHNRNNMQRLYNEMMLIANGQINRLRVLTKEQTETLSSSSRLQTKVEHDDALYDGTSRLNNELVNLQRELTKQKVELERLNAQKNQLLGMASHDLRNPLSAVLAYSEFLLASAFPRLDVEEQEYLSLIHSLADLMLDVVNDLLDVSTIESGKLQLDLHPVDVVALIKYTITVNRPMAAKKTIELIADCPDALPLQMLDGHKIEQVLNNLITNAVKYSHPQTCVIVSARRNEDETIIAVQDQGQGIPAHEFDRLFKPFTTTSVKSTAGEKSVGLGLVIAKKVVEGHQGRIWVESTAGRGSTFFFALPDTSAAAELAATPHLLEAQPIGRPLRILLVEDSIVNQRIALKILEQLGYQADAVADGVAALAALRDHIYDLVLMDIYMPGMDGLEATRHIRQELPSARQPRIVAMTARVQTGDRRRYLDAGMDDSIDKPTPSRTQQLRKILVSCTPLTDANPNAEI